MAPMMVFCRHSDEMPVVFVEVVCSFVAPGTFQKNLREFWINIGTSLLSLGIPSRDEVSLSFASELYDARVIRVNDGSDENLRKRLLKRLFFFVQSLMPDRGWEFRVGV